MPQSPARRANQAIEIIQNTTHYTALAPDRFKSFWRD
jgi:hypothetical protein